MSRQRPPAPPHRSAQPVRAPLFVPALDDRKRDRAWRMGVSAMILDLEDAVADRRKVEAREHLRDLERHGDSEVWVRVNPVGSRFWDDDVRTIAPVADVIMLPKVQEASDLDRFQDVLDSSDGDPAVVPLIETASGLWRINQICGTLPPRTRQLALGLGDLSTDLGIPWQPLGTIGTHARSVIAIASKAWGLPPPLDTVYPRPKELDGLREETYAAKNAGFGGKMCIHPDQVSVVEEILGPSPADIERASRIVDAFHEAEEAGSAAIVVDGEFVDYPVVEQAVQTLRAAGREATWERAGVDGSHSEPQSSEIREAGDNG